MPLIPDSPIERPPTDQRQGREPPARRLGILYISSLTAIAILSGVSLEFALREVNWQSAASRALSRSAREASLDRELSVPALQLLTANTADARRGSLEELRKEVTRRGDNPKLAALREAARHLDGSVSTGVETTETHLRAALAASRNLINAFPPQAAETPTSTTLRPLVDQLLSETNAYQVACHRTIQAMEQKAAGHVEHLRSLEFKLFLFVMVVLLLEGLFVISPAVAKLQQIIAEMERSHRELRNYAGKLERSNRELQDFASVASHDLQEPLRKVQAFSDRLVTKYAGVLDEQGRDYLERVQNAARRMQTLINDLLTYSRITTKAMPFVPVDLGTATREVLADLEVRIERTGGRVEVAELPTIDADPIQVRQLMQNLIGNALKYHRPEAAPVVKVYASPPQARDDGLCHLVVEDNGIGFEEEYTERIFGIFQRLHGRAEYEGTGVGLAVCRKIVERHGGTVTARSTPGVGSTFLVALPIRQPRGESHDERAA